MNLDAALRDLVADTVRTVVREELAELRRDLGDPRAAYTVAEAARAWQVSEDVVYRLIRSGQIPTVTALDGVRATRIPAWVVESREVA